MAKSTRSKVKRHFRAKKRETGVYAAVEAARLQRLSSKLTAVRNTDNDGHLEEEGVMKDVADLQESATLDKPASAETMELDDADASSAVAKKVSTHGPRGSRREQWRASKGLDPRPQSKGMNRQGGVSAKRKAGRCHRRR